MEIFQSIEPEGPEVSTRDLRDLGTRHRYDKNRGEEWQWGHGDEPTQGNKGDGRFLGGCSWVWGLKPLGEAMLPLASPCHVCPWSAYGQIFVLGMN